MEERNIEQPYKPNMLAFKSSLIYAVYFLALMYLLKFLGVSSSNPDATSISEKIISQLLTYVPFILAIVFVQTNYKKELGGYITFGKAFSAGFKVAAYTGLFVALVTLLYYMVLDRASFDEMMDVMKAKAAENAGGEEGFKKMQSFMPVMIAFGVAVAYTFYGLIVSLIGAAIIKKEKPLYNEE